MHDYRTSRALQEEKLREATLWNRNDAPFLRGWLRRVYKTASSGPSLHELALWRQTREERTS